MKKSHPHGTLAASRVYASWDAAFYGRATWVSSFRNTAGVA